MPLVGTLIYRSKVQLLRPQKEVPNAARFSVNRPHFFYIQDKGSLTGLAGLLRQLINPLHRRVAF